jgi:hypothetical protein
VPGPRPRERLGPGCGGRFPRARDRRRGAGHRMPAATVRTARRASRRRGARPRHSGTRAGARLGPAGRASAGPVLSAARDRSYGVRAVSGCRKRDRPPEPRAPGHGLVGAADEGRVRGPGTWKTARGRAAGRSSSTVDRRCIRRYRGAVPGWVRRFRYARAVARRSRRCGWSGGGAVGPGVGGHRGVRRYPVRDLGGCGVVRRGSGGSRCRRSLWRAPASRAGRAGPRRVGPRRSPPGPPGRPPGSAVCPARTR